MLVDSCLICIFSSWCVTCDAAPNSGCKTNQHIIADHENEKEEIEGLLGEISNNFKKAATSREEFQNKFLQQRVDHLEAKLKQAKSEKSQNSTCLNELKLCIANYVEKKLIPIERGDFAFGYGSTKKNLKKILQKAKKEASFSMGFLINQNNLENSAPDEDIEVFAIVKVSLILIIKYLPTFLPLIIGSSSSLFTSRAKSHH